MLLPFIIIDKEVLSLEKNKNLVVAIFQERWLNFNQSLTLRSTWLSFAFAVYYFCKIKSRQCHRDIKLF